MCDRQLIIATDEYGNTSAHFETFLKFVVCICQLPLVLTVGLVISPIFVEVFVELHKRELVWKT